MPEPVINTLIVEDEGEIRSLMSLHLEREGHQVQAFDTAERALLEISSKSYDLIVVDWMLPGMSGVEFLNRLPGEVGFQNQPSILMVTAKMEPEDIVRGLESGADDYLMKPFHVKVFLARVRALLRRRFHRSDGIESTEIVVGNLRLNKKNHEVRLDDVALSLTLSEYKLLLTMMESHGRVLTRDQLIESTQGEGVNVIGRTIDTHVFGLRKKLGAWSERVETIRGVGYRVKLDS